MTMATAVLAVSASVIGGAISYFLAKYFVEENFLPDQPNGRSSHRRTTPRAGGFAIFGGFLAAVVIYSAQQALSGGGFEFAPLAGLGLAAFAFGAVDDVYRLRARLKLAVQIALAAGFVAFYGPLDYLPSPFGDAIGLGAASYALSVFWIVAFMNAFNFMDGVNGIAGACGVFFLCALAVAAGPVDNVAAMFATFVAATLFGFLPHNFRTGRIFMGDSGSQFVGFMIAALALLAARGGGVTPLFAPIAMSPFLVDVAFTLAHRARRGRNVFEAHNEHVYQLLVRMGRSHQFVATLYLALTAGSSTIALMIDRALASAQYLATAALVAGQLVLAAAVWRKARAEGLLTNEDGAPAPDEVGEEFSAAAE